ncbi:hypothetical protein [Aquimarina sp. 2201CG5-10]|uniref:hypothetical protein n=1 Tax=Aquimarina callyspongiae TaxID=3098150 RepID=UPI002AB52E2E|nr:hypothetical protein [Aquimarina sp. 2201CG5-10]MDY8137271.1 hypothetical protein [Aquimarina sp. 2201CG5-10]
MLESLFVENKKAPKETIIYYSKRYKVFNLIVSILLLGFGIYVFFYHNYYLGTGIVILSIYGIRNYHKSPKNDVPQLILSEEGIIFNGKRIRKWSEIKNEDIIVKPSYSGGQGEYYLSYDHKNGNEEIFINELNISTQKLNYLLKIYRNRSEKK